MESESVFNKEMLTCGAPINGDFICISPKTFNVLVHPLEGELLIFQTQVVLDHRGQTEEPKDSQSVVETHPYHIVDSHETGQVINSFSPTEQVKRPSVDVEKHRSQVLRTFLDWHVNVDENALFAYFIDGR